MIRKVVFYTGRVQGVGFRFTVADLARGLRVAGYVQNLDDGRVRLDVQGESDQVDALIDAIGQRMAGYIRAQDATDYPPDPALGDASAAGSFAIRR